jgi:hypothetical protein
VSGSEAGNTAQITESPGGGGTTTQIGDIRAGRDVNIGASPAELIRLTEVFSNQIGVSTEALAKAEARAADLATQLGFTAEAVIGFFRTIGEQEVPLEKVPAKLAEIAAQHRGGHRETKPSIAVLPFQNMSGDPSQEYFADGMVDEITTALSRSAGYMWYPGIPASPTKVRRSTQDRSGANWTWATYSKVRSGRAAIGCASPRN